MVQKVAVSREFEARLRQAVTGKLSLSTQQKMGTFFELEKDKAAKGEMGSAFHQLCPSYSGTLTPTAIRLWETFTFYLVNGHGVRPQESGPRCLAKGVQGATCVRCLEHFPSCFGSRLVDEHGTRPRQFGPRYLR